MNVRLDTTTGEVLPTTPEGWAERITEHWSRSVASLVAAGRDLCAAKASLGHGTWLQMVAQLPFGVRTAQFLVRIAENPVLSNAIHGSHLPASYRTLGVLASINPKHLEEAIVAGSVTPELTRKQAEQLTVRLRSDGEEECATERAALLSPTSGTFRTICADPPWRYDNNLTRGAAEDHYSTLSVAQLLGAEPLPSGGPNSGERITELVREWAAPDGCHLYIWTTNAFLRDTFDIMAAWGFDYKATLVWVKPQMGMGNYFRISHELVLFGITSGLGTRVNNLKSWLEAHRTKHSSKPELFYRELVVPASPGPYLEMFARPPDQQQLDDSELRRPGDWTYWGNQA